MSYGMSIGVIFFGIEAENATIQTRIAMGNHRFMPAKLRKKDYFCSHLKRMPWKKKENPL